LLWHTSTVELPADRRQSSRTGSPWVDIVFSSRSLEDNCRRAETRGRLSVPRHQDQSGPRRSASCSCGGQRKGEMYPICFQKSMPSCFLYKPSDARCFSWLAARRAPAYCQWEIGRSRTGTRPTPRSVVHLIRLRKAGLTQLMRMAEPQVRIHIPLADSRGNHGFLSGGDQNADVIEGFGGIGFPGAGRRG